MYGNAYVVKDTHIHLHAVTMQPSVLTVQLLPVQNISGHTCFGSALSPCHYAKLSMTTRCAVAFKQVITSSEQPLEGAMVQSIMHRSYSSGSHGSGIL